MRGPDEHGPDHVGTSHRAPKRRSTGDVDGERDDAQGGARRGRCQRHAELLAACDAAKIAGGCSSERRLSLGARSPPRRHRAPWLSRPRAAGRCRAAPAAPPSRRPFPRWDVTDIAVADTQPDALARLFRFDECFYVYAATGPGRDEMRLELTHRFAISLRDGFEYIVEPRNWPEYWPGLLRVEPGSRWRSPGDRACVVMRLLGRTVELEMTLHGWRPRCRRSVARERRTCVGSRPRIWGFSGTASWVRPAGQGEGPTARDARPDVRGSGRRAPDARGCDP